MRQYYVKQSKQPALKDSEQRCHGDEGASHIVVREIGTQEAECITGGLERHFKH